MSELRLMVKSSPPFVLGKGIDSFIVLMIIGICNGDECKNHITHANC